MRRITIVESNSACFASSLFSIQYHLYFLFIRCHRFLCYNISSHFHTPNDELMMSAIHCRDNQNIWFCIPHHFFEIGISRARSTNDTLARFYTPLVFITKPNKFKIVRIVFLNISPPHRGSSASRSNKSNTQFFPNLGSCFHCSNFHI